MKVAAKAFLSVLLVSLILLPQTVAAQGRETIGWGRLFTNDFLGDNQDRWRTGAYVVSKVIGPHWVGERPTRMGEMLEFRFRSETIAPSNLSNPAPDDRRYAGVFSAGVHTHFDRNGLEMSLGGDLVVVGPVTGVGWFQTEVHKIFGAPVPDLSNELPNHIYPTLLAEAGQSFQITPSLKLRPFLEAQVGVETYARLGFDMLFGNVGQRDFFMRDVTTGHLYRATETKGKGFSGVLGADIAYVENSAYLPGYDGYELTDARMRVRAGMHWQGERNSIFYGVTWLSEEFEAQTESQIVGSVRLNFRF
ncbi:lipid A-modifier LpxR family protein [Psychromarinibacter sp. S121]|uniref:lipid A-modifier LpxR family protein n=1 Tax=Psychromarinibacter sp. S121 TaxID=3415127 RepID=UPI003C7BFB04